jgi:triosephosphate isomerase
VWAISGGNENHPMDTPENSAEIARFVRSFLSAACFLPPATPVLYGGSVKARNISAFLRREEIGGVLVGEASIKHTEFAKMMAIAARLC